MNHEINANHYGPTITADFFRTMVGEKLGAGSAREVYRLAHDPTLVVKIENRAGSFQNILEHEMWQEVEHTKWARWFAPCVTISPCGTILIQKATVPLPPGAFPKQLPNFFTDLRLNNFGRLDGRVVAHDYGLHSVMGRGLSRGRLANVPKTRWYS